jgi:predicted house-cleaning noncanonical NTP pyrophosphatase (MazG superfamily)
VANSQKNADEAAEEQARIMKQYTTEITEFSSAMSYKMNESLSSQYELISDTIENSNYSEATLSAIRDMYSTVIAIFENPEISKLAKNIENKLGSKGKDFLTDIASALEGLGESSLQQALQTVSDSLNKGASAVEAASQLYVDIADKDSVYFKEQEAE